jgi:hypothetical protein
MLSGEPQAHERLFRKILGGTGFQPVQHRLKTCATIILYMFYG